MGKKYNVDFSNVENYALIDEGVYSVKILKAEEGTTQNGDDMIKATFQILKGDFKGQNLFDNFPIVDKALWKLKQMLEACGKKAEGKVAIDIAKLVGLTCKVNVEHEEYRSKERAKITEYISATSSAEEDETASEEDVSDDDWSEDDDWK